MSGVQASVVVAMGSTTLDLELDVPRGTVTAVLGPNGSGKTTLLRTIAGLVALDGGCIRIDGDIVDAPADPSGGTSEVFVPPERRRVGWMPQGHLLLDHMSALDNVAFALRSRGVRRGDARHRALAELGRVGLQDLAGARPHTLSGGQSQRVALARALVAEPSLLLLDEPMAALDASVRPTTRRDLRHRLAGFSGATVLVTHDPLDALALADDVVVLERGSVSQAGPIAEVTARPRSPYVADLLGTNLLSGVATGHTVVLDTRIGGESAEVHLAEEASGAVFLVVAPSAVSVLPRSAHDAAPPGSPRNHWPLRVHDTAPMGERVMVALTGALEITAAVTPSAVADLELGPGRNVWATVKATEVRAYPR